MNNPTTFTDPTGLLMSQCQVYGICPSSGNGGAGGAGGGGEDGGGGPQPCSLVRLDGFVHPELRPCGSSPGAGGSGQGTAPPPPQKPSPKPPAPAPPTLQPGPCRIVDPFLGALEFTFKLGPEVKVGPVELGGSIYKNLMTGATGTEMEAGVSGAVSLQADNPTPDGGSLNGGGPSNIQYSGTFLGFQYNFATGNFTFNPSKSFSLGAQLLVGGEVSFNPNTYNQLVTANAACRAQGGS